MDSHLTRHRSLRISTSFVNVHGTPQPTRQTISYTESSPIIPDATLSLPSHTAFPESYQQPPVGQDSLWPASPSSPHYPLYRSISFPRLIIHPYLKAKSPRSERLIFDFSEPTFSPFRYMVPGHAVRCSPEELNQLATDPPIRRLRITCDPIQQWPIDLNHGAPISVYDVMMAIWQTFHVEIRDHDWAKLSRAKQRQVKEAYKKRCRAVRTSANQGMKRVDLLLKEVRFKGLLRVDNSYDELWLIVGEA